MRNLSLDPTLYLKAVKRPKGSAIGVANLVAMLKDEFPRLVIGYFNLPESDIQTNRRGMEHAK